MFVRADRLCRVCTGKPLAIDMEVHGFAVKVPFPENLITKPVRVVIKSNNSM